MTDASHPSAGDAPAPLSVPGAEAEILEALIEGTAEGLALLSRDGQILRVNGAAEHLLGMQRHELVGRYVTDEDIGLSVDGAWILEARSGRDAVGRTVDLAAGGKALVTIRAWRGADEQPRYLILVVRDVTNTSQLLERAQATPAAATTRWWQMRRNDVGIHRVVMESRAMRAVAEKALQFAQVDSPVLIVGETGTGKTLFSRIIHQASSRAGATLREVNCGAIPAGLMESELFGYARGAFTGADARGKTGLVELANGGTLLLDEIGDLPLLLQVKLLQFLEGGEVWPVGAAKPKRVDVRVIGATNADLADMVAQGSFRRDLFYRLNVLELQVPPLREHPEDVPSLVEMMARSLETRSGKRVKIAPDALELLARYPFPGNVRELWNIVERLMVSCRSEVVGVTDLPPEITQAALARGVPDGPTNLRQVLRKVEAGIVREALQRYGSQTKAAKHLGVGQATIARKARLLALADEPRPSISG
ncbi:MAG TPA: sigma 54-interacting transcriptional regulator [Methylomirabilota bacterium]